MKYLKNICLVLDVIIYYIASPGYALAYLLPQLIGKYFLYGTLK